MYLKPLTWQLAWGYPAFRIKFLLGIAILIGILLFIPQFFERIEDREGIVLNDIILSKIPSANVSIYIFSILYSSIIFFFFRITKDMEICISMLWSFIFLCLIRMITISLVKLNPPIGMIDLADPCSIIFYRSNSITKDLFFSGHTATIILGGFCLKRRKDKWIAFTAGAAIGILVLVQHIHYTIDVLAAPLFCWLCWYLGQKVAKI
ncbi:hypothetical protein ACVWYN_002328 [Pedobacter sp. UYP24]